MINGNKVEEIEKWIKRGLKEGEDALKIGNGLISLGIDSLLVNQAQKNLKDKINKIRILKDPPNSHQRQATGWWYDGPADTDTFWPKFKIHLLEKGWSEKVINSIDLTSTKIVSLLEPPGMGQFNTRGLVLGYIQSGKTTNYTAVISKAADVGYKLFIILSGITNTLRSQTQKRLNEELTLLNPEIWVSLTDLNHDFGEIKNLNINALLTQRAHQKFFAVVKKNTHPLTKLLDWLMTASKEVLRDCPVILIDDEADLASINISGIQDPEIDERSKINALIIKLLECLTKRVYLGYTATPFANVLIDPSDEQDLYPKDFILSLPKPDNYYGPEMIFGREPLKFDENDSEYEGSNIINTVDDKELENLHPKSQKDAITFTPILTSSLKNSILYFLLATTARFFRDKKENNSTMLIHTTRLTNIQLSYEPILIELKDQIIKELEKNNQEFILDLRKLWENQMELLRFNNMQYVRIKFEDFLPNLINIVKKTNIFIQNSKTDADILKEYETGPGVFIIVGGNILSRGLTLEGLIVSYYIRDADAYDTLLQMGRWFGYHEGYKDLIRIWMTIKLQEFFYHLATVEQEIRYDIQRYEDSPITPLDFAVRIRTHPTLRVTSPLKAHSAIPCDVSYSGKRIQTYYYKHKDKLWLENNIKAVINLIQNLKINNFQEKAIKSHYMFENIDLDFIIDFLNQYKIHEKPLENSNKYILEYLQKNREYHLKWNVVIISRETEIKAENGEKIEAKINLGLSNNINLISRAKTDLPISEYANIKGLVSLEDLIIDLKKPDGNPITLSEILNNVNIEYPERYHESVIIARENILHGIGLLLIYPISKDSMPQRSGINIKSSRLDALSHVIGIGIYFPVSTKADQGYITVSLPEK